VTRFIELLSRDAYLQRAAFQFIENTWQVSYAPMILEIVVLSRDANVATQFIRLLEHNTGQSFGFDLDGWYRWIRPGLPASSAHYADFKAARCRHIDPRIEQCFRNDRATRIRLDEIR